MSANDRQVGGDHYQNPIMQHWDFVTLTGIGYLEANSTKYLTRYKKTKTSQADVQKALHYVEKLIEVAAQVRDARRNMRWIRQETLAFTRANGLTPTVAQIIMTIATWETVDDLKSARDGIRLLINEEFWGNPENLTGGTESAVPEPAAVPLTDSNKHGERRVPRYDDEDQPQGDAQGVGAAEAGAERP
jgi:hypothetical protein